MPISADHIESLCRNALEAMGVSPQDASVVADHMVEADLMGVRSHGVLRLEKYIEQIEAGYIDPSGAIELESVSPGLVRVSANRNFGICAFSRLVPELIERSRRHGIAAGAVTDCAHTGRIGAFTEAAARDFTWAQVFGGGAHERLREVAPFGGAEGIYDTNPYAIGVPIGDGDVASADFATSATAQGKMLVHRTNKTPVPDGWIIDRHGNDATDAEAFYDGGAMLPSAGSKGGALAVVAELMARAALGPPHELNWIMVIIDLAFLADRPTYDVAAKEIKDKIEGCRPRPGFDAVMWPGQPETLRRSEQLASGITYTKSEQETIRALADRFGLLGQFSLD